MSCLEEEQICDKCELNYPISNFRKYSATRFNKTCKKCVNEYDKLRKKVAKVLRVIHRYRTEKDNEKYHQVLLKLSKEAKESIHKGNLEFDSLIREDLITVDMASSYVNDSDNVNDIIKKLIEIADLLYSKKDSLLDNEIKQ